MTIVQWFMVGYIILTQVALQSGRYDIAKAILPASCILLIAEGMKIALI